MTAPELIDRLPVAVYMTDPEGRITYYNEAAAQLWGNRPELGTDCWCGSWRLFWPDGQPMAHDECPMAIALRQGRELRGVDAVAERPDGTRVPFVPYPTLLRDESGQITGAINLLIDVTERKDEELVSARLAAIVSSSDDAIISKSLEGEVTSWNAGASKIFGYKPEEMIGRSIKLIIPPELHHEEDEILGKIRRGEHVDHYDTVRVTKDGQRINISLTVSPIRNRMGTIVGASKVGRDVTERKRSEELQRLLLDELNHRVKNTLATIQSIASQSLRRSASPADFVRSFNGRVQALARAHDLLVRGEMRGAEVAEIVREQVLLGGSDASRASFEGPVVWLDPKTAVQIALVLHELATNARKYGALSAPTGRLSIKWDIQADRKFAIAWTESGVPRVRAPTSRGFGTTLIERTLQAHGGEAHIRYGADGLVCSILLQLTEERPGSMGGNIGPDRSGGRPARVEGGRVQELAGKRILVVEDEPLVAMDIEDQLGELGCTVVGPAATLGQARKLIEEAGFDAALLDVNIGESSSEALAAALTRENIPFAFATGYGPHGLPQAFSKTPILSKPFSREQLEAILTFLLDRGRLSGVVPIRSTKLGT